MTERLSASADDLDRLERHFQAVDADAADEAGEFLIDMVNEATRLAAPTEPLEGGLITSANEKFKPPYPELGKVGRVRAVINKLSGVSDPNKPPFRVPPAQTPYQYAFPFSSYQGPVDSAESVVETRHRLSEYGLREFLEDED